MFKRIDHIGIAVEDLEAGIALWSERLGLALAHRERVESQGVEAALLDVGENHVELLAPLHEDTPVGKFLARRGPGLHHIAYQVDDIDATLAQLSEEGVTLLDQRPRVGIRGSRVAFLDPRGLERVLVEVVQPAEH
ncbi:MAG TPA: methylmalonyl-CoA epimerase [Solirubrobacteraceae bacterium]|nr:methylmalonyl-CoA epimerase [Solirubrobacteraceae bacterium]